LVRALHWYCRGARFDS